MATDPFVQASDVSWDDDDPEHPLRLDLAPAATTDGAPGAPEEDR